MKSLSKVFFVAALLAAPTLVRAEDMTRSTGGPMSSLDRIKTRRDMHQKQIDKINSYLKEREGMPSASRSAADDKFLSTLRGDNKERREHKKAAAGKKEKKRKMGDDNVNPYSN